MITKSWAMDFLPRPKRRAMGDAFLLSIKRSATMVPILPAPTRPILLIRSTCVPQRVSTLERFSLAARTPIKLPSLRTVSPLGRMAPLSVSKKTTTHLKSISVRMFLSSRPSSGESFSILSLVSSYLESSKETTSLTAPCSTALTIASAASTSG